MDSLTVVTVKRRDGGENDMWDFNYYGQGVPIPDVGETIEITTTPYASREGDGQSPSRHFRKYRVVGRSFYYGSSQLYEHGTRMEVGVTLEVEAC